MSSSSIDETSNMGSSLVGSENMEGEEYDMQDYDENEKKGGFGWWKIGIVIAILVVVGAVAMSMSGPSDPDPNAENPEEKKPGFLAKTEDKKDVEKKQSGGCGTGCILAIVGAVVVVAAAAGTIAYCFCCNAATTTKKAEEAPKDCSETLKKDCMCKKKDDDKATPKQCKKDEECQADGTCLKVEEAGDKTTCASDITGKEDITGKKFDVTGCKAIDDKYKSAAELTTDCTDTAFNSEAETGCLKTCCKETA